MYFMDHHLNILTYKFYIILLIWFIFLITEYENIDITKCLSSPKRCILYEDQDRILV